MLKFKFVNGKILQEITYFSHDRSRRKYVCKQKFPTPEIKYKNEVYSEISDYYSLLIMSSCKK